MLNIWNVTDKSPFCQTSIDARRLKLATRRLRAFMASGNKELLKPIHLWYPYPRYTIYEFRNGFAPQRSDRPDHLRDKNLDIHIAPIIERLIKVTESNPINDNDFEASVQFAKAMQIDLPAFLPNQVATNSLGAA